MDIVPQQLRVQASSGFGGDERIQVREINAKDSLAEIKDSIKDNNLDEIIIEAENGNKFIVYADELDIELGTVAEAKEGDIVRLFGTDLEGTIVHINDEINEEMVASAAAVPIAAAAVVGSVFVAGAMGAFSALSALSAAAAKAGIVTVAGAGAVGGTALSFSKIASEDYDSIENFTKISKDSTSYQTKLSY